MHAFLKPVLTGAFMGAVIGGGTAWALDGGVTRYMQETGARMALNSCLRAVEKGGPAIVSRDSAGKVQCRFTTPQTPRL